MPNLTGGKKYKSSKNLESKVVQHEINEADGQSVGRVIKNLGDRNLLLYCNDGKERICHIRGGMSRKKGHIEVGDVVLQSLRTGFSTATSSTTKERGDILAKQEREVLHLLKKEPGINANLFVQLEAADARQRASGRMEDEGGQIFDHDADSGDEEGEEAREQKKEAEALKRSTAREQKLAPPTGDGEDVDIDAI